MGHVTHTRLNTNVSFSVLCYFEIIARYNVLLSTIYCLSTQSFNLV